jgi:tetratricopeptide (TPR) repeat protein
VSDDPGRTQDVVNSLKEQLKELGSARVITSAVPGWGKTEDVRRTAREVKGRSVLTGTVRNDGGQLRISLRLLDPASGQTLLATVLDQSEAAAIGQPSEKAQQWVRDIHTILNADNWSDVLNARIDPVVRNEEANEALKSGRIWVSRYTANDIDHAIGQFRKAIAKEPNSALAHSYLAMAASGRFHFVADPKYLELGKSEAFIALSLQPNSVEAHRALAGVYFQEGKFADALEEAMRTLEMAGAEERLAVFVGMTVDIIGRPDLALRWYQVAAKLQAKPGEVEASIGDSWARLGGDEQAMRAYDRAIELQPGSSQGAVGKAHVYLLRGEFEAAREVCLNRFHNTNDLGEMAQVAAQIEFFARNYAAAEELYTNLARIDAQGGGSFYGTITYQSALGRIKQALGYHDVANQLLRESLEREKAAFSQQPGNSEIAYRLAAVEAALNLVEPALQHLKQAAAMGWIEYRSLQKDPRFDSLRSTPELDTFVDGLSARVAEMKNNTNAR